MRFFLSDTRTLTTLILSLQGQPPDPQANFDLWEQCFHGNNQWPLLTSVATWPDSLDSFYIDQVWLGLI